MNEHPPVVVDTNVLVSGLLNPFGAPGRLVDLVLARQVRVVSNDRMMLEYRQVLAREKFGFSSGQIERVLAVFALQPPVVTAPWPHLPLPDHADAIFLEVAAATTGVVVTGNIRHFPENRRGEVAVMTPAAWLASHFGVRL